MGQGIAEMLAAKGLDVMLVEKNTERLEYSYEMIETSLDKQLEKWAITQAEKKLILSRIQKVTHFAELSSCDMVIETITEDLEAKQKYLISSTKCVRATLFLPATRQRSA